MNDPGPAPDGGYPHRCGAIFSALLRCVANFSNESQTFWRLLPGAVPPAPDPSMAGSIPAPTRLFQYSPADISVTPASVAYVYLGNDSAIARSGYTYPAWERAGEAFSPVTDNRVLEIPPMDVRLG